METYLVVSVLGKDRPGIVESLAQCINECGCSINESRMTVLGDEFAAMMLLSGNWNAIAKLEHALPRLEEKMELQVQARRTEARTASENLIPYGIEVVSIDHRGIVHDIANFFYQRNINIEDAFTSTYHAPHTGALMFSLHMTVGIPAETAIATLRGEFMDFCDDRNLDAMLAPVK